MYILIFEDGEAKYASKVEQSDLDYVDHGVLQIFNITSEPPAEYYSGEWHELESADGE